MKFTSKSVTAPKEILYNDHYVAIPYDCSDIADNSGIVPAGTIIPSNDGNAIGVLLSDVTKADNPNGTVVIHGFIKQEALPANPSSAAITALKNVVFMDKHRKPQPQKYSVTYDLNGATGTAVTDGSSPYSAGATVTVNAAPTITTYPTGTTQFDKWNTAADGSGTSYAASATFAIYDNVKLYAIYKA